MNPGTLAYTLKRLLPLAAGALLASSAWALDSQVIIDDSVTYTFDAETSVGIAPVPPVIIKQKKAVPWANPQLMKLIEKAKQKKQARKAHNAAVADGSIARPGIGGIGGISNESGGGIGSVGGIIGGIGAGGENGGSASAEAPPAMETRLERNAPKPADNKPAAPLPAPVQNTGAGERTESTGGGIGETGGGMGETGGDSGIGKVGGAIGTVGNPFEPAEEDAEEEPAAEAP